jgi:hypothetical protein
MIIANDLNLEIVERIKAGESVASISAAYGIGRRRIDRIFRLLCPGESIVKYKVEARKAAVRQAIARGTTAINAIAAELRCSYPVAWQIVNELKDEDPCIAALLAPESLVGKTFGYWEVLEDTSYYKQWDGTFTESLDSATHRAIHLKCRCSCASKPFDFVARRNLTSGTSRGCIKCMVKRSPKHPGHKAHQGVQL